MKIRVNKINFFEFIYCFFLISRLTSYVNGWEHSFYTPISILFLLSLLVINVYIKKSVFGKYEKGIIIGFIVWILWGIIYGWLGALDKIAVYSHMRESIVFYANVFLSARIVKTYSAKDKFISTNIIIIGLFLLWRYIIDFNGLEVLKYLSNMFSSDADSRYRISYGLYHFNATGNLCWFFLMSVGLLLASYYDKRRKMRKTAKIFIILVSCIAILMMLSTGSRNAITSTLVFVGMYLFIVSWEKNGKIWRFIQAVVLIIIVIGFMWTADISALLLKSNRLFNFTHNIPLLTKFNSWITGLGFVDSGYFGLKTSVFDSIYVDNFYLYVLLSTGVIGCIVLFVPMIRFVIHFCKKIVQKNMYNKCLAAALLTVLYAAFFETNLLYPMFISSFALWTLFLAREGKRVEDEN